MKKLTIGLIGNPNSGKTTLFNQLTGSRQRVGNWAGVTVERKEGQFSTTDHQVTLVDLPGTYSLTTISSQTSLDEFARNRRADKAFTPHLATNALPDIKVPENISGIFIPQPNS